MNITDLIRKYPCCDIEIITPNNKRFIKDIVDDLISQQYSISLSRSYIIVVDKHKRNQLCEWLIINKKKYQFQYCSYTEKMTDQQLIIFDSYR